MTRILKLETAKIYQFPLHRRMARKNLGESAAPAIEAQMPEGCETVSESWYHEAAIREEQARKQ